MNDDTLPDPPREPPLTVGAPRPPAAPAPKSPAPTHSGWHIAADVRSAAAAASSAASSSAVTSPQVLVQVSGLGMRHDRGWVQRGLNFEVEAGRALAIIGPSGCGKSTLLKHMIGLMRPAEGQVRYAMPGRTGAPDIDIHQCDAEQARTLRRHFGVSFQGGALWSTMTLLENLMLPLAMLSDEPPARQRERAMARLAEVDLAEHAQKAPGELSGGMRKRAAIARALVLDPPLLYLDEPSAGLDPVSAARLDTLLRGLRDAGTALVIITHDLASIEAVADRALYLDPQRRTALALDTPAALRDHGPRQVQDFLARRAGEPQPASPTPTAKTPQEALHG